MKTILIVEDEHLLRENLEEMLSTAGFNTVAAQNGKDALDKLQEGIPDLVLSDIKMPEMDGLELLNHLQNRSEYLDIPFILLTAKTEITDIQKGMSLGADDYITKPFTYIGLLKSIKTRINNSKKSSPQDNNSNNYFFSEILKGLQNPFNSTIVFDPLFIRKLEKLEVNELNEIVQIIQNSELKLHKAIQKVLIYVQVLISLKDKSSVKSLRQKTAKININYIESILAGQIKKYNRLNDIILYVDEARLKIDEIHLTNILNELIENSLAYSMKESPVNILGVNLGKTYIFHIDNTGGSMVLNRAGDLDNLLETTVKRNKYTSGLGLHIIKKITELFGCTLEIDSKIGLYTKINLKIPIEESNN